MPIYEYVCQGCGHAFELLVFSGIKPRCPKCDAEELARGFSVFAVGSSKPSGPTACADNAPCASCPGAGGPGCGMGFD